MSCRIRSRSDSRASRTQGCIGPSSQQVVTNDTERANCGVACDHLRGPVQLTCSSRSACAHVGHVLHLDVLHLLAWVWRVDDVAVTGVQRDMFDAGVEEDQVAVPEIGFGDLLADAVLLAGRVRQAHSSRLPGLHAEAGAVPAVGASGIAYVWIAELFLGKCQCFLALGMSVWRLGDRFRDRFLDDGRSDDLAGLQRLPE